MKGVLQAMLLNKVKVVTLLVAVCGTTAGVVFYPNAIAAPKLPAKPSEKLQALLKARLEAAKTEVDARNKEFEAGRGTLVFIFDASKRLLQAELEVSDKKSDRLAAYEAFLKLAKEIEETNKQRFDDGKIPVQDLAQATYYRLEAEIWLEREKDR
jgi:outer membrane protein TolC